MQKNLHYCLASLSKLDPPASNKIPQEAITDIQSIYSNLSRALDAKSDQFNDRLISICESLIPGLSGAKNSFEESANEIMNDFLGKGNKLLDDTQAGKCFWNLGNTIYNKIHLGLHRVEFRGSIVEEYNKYLDKDNALTNTSINPLSYWRNELSLKRYPHLGRLALKIFSINTVNADVERSFKTTKFVFPTERNRLTVDNFELESII